MKIGKNVDRRELAEFLRRIADALEKGGTGELECVNEFREIKIGVKNEYDRLNLKAKIKTPETCAPPQPDDGTAPPEKPDYTALKKRMKSSFKLLVRLIHEGRIPPTEAVESFLDDSALMITYPGYGDEYYGSYAEACETFRKAFERGDLAQMHQAVDALIHEKSRCHAKYD